MHKLDFKISNRQSGFTLMEIIIATALFITVVASVMSLFNYVLKINRRVQAMRQVTQGSRNFTEAVVREIRNGQIDYNSTNSNCPSAGYQSTSNSSLAIITSLGDRLCYYLNTNTQQLMLSKTSSSSTTEESVNPPNFKIRQGTFRLIVRPGSNPKVNPYPGVQPMVTIIAKFEVQLPGAIESMVIPYQTTISADSYDIPHN